jgi:colanic acid biosynthesis glycosyl transferase WcaI
MAGFRREHGLGDRFVVMYSGNHTATNPLDTLLAAALALRDDPRLCFAFVGGGGGKPAVDAFIERHGLTNTLSLPYQPLDQVARTLAAADVHAVTMGAQLVGIIHPCKVYGAMAAGRPVLFIGPRPSHITELLERADMGWHAQHGDVDALVQLLRTLPDLPQSRLREMGESARDAVRTWVDRDALRGDLCDIIEDAAGYGPSAALSGSRA